MPEVSVIVPVYNAEKALERCIESIIGQEFTDFELILVDDGSADSSGEICDRFAERDGRIRVIHKENEGVSCARNTGIAAAGGTFLQFLDADDWIPDDSTKLLVRSAVENNADLVVGEFYRVVADKLSCKGSILSDAVLDRKEYAEYMAESPADYYYGVIWNKLYRREIIEEYSIRMDPEVSFCEDFIFNLEYVLHCQKIVPLQAPVYYYVKTEGSLVSKNLNPSRLIRMKTSVYEYYDRFFREILDEREYRAERLEIASFLVSAASDEFTLPILPGTRKVGEEEVGLHYHPGGENISSALYYLNKLQEKYLRTTAQMHDLDYRDLRVFEAVRNGGEIRSLRELTDFTGLSEAALLLSLQKLAGRGYVSFRLDFSGFHLSEGDDVSSLCRDLDHVQEDALNVLFSGLGEEEIQQAVQTFRKILINVKNVFRNG